MKKNNNKISVIVPVYNVEDYLERCILSLIDQTYADLEIILVDDGSTDNSGNICDIFAKKDERIKVIHKKNGGVSSARNLGIKNSTGELIGFVDSDDYVDKNMYEILFNNLNDSNADISICSSYDVVDESARHNKIANIKEEYNNVEALEKMISNGYYGTGVFNKLFKKNLLINTPFDEKLSNGEEFLVLFSALFNSKKVIYDSNPLYYYVVRNTSVTHCFKVNIGLVMNFQNALNRYRDIINNNYDFRNKFYTHYILACFQQYNRCIVNGDNNELKNNLSFEIHKYKRYIDKIELTQSKQFQLFMFYYFKLLYDLIAKFILCKKWKGAYYENKQVF